jgi:hypothetical protein
MSRILQPVADQSGVQFLFPDLLDAYLSGLRRESFGADGFNTSSVW